MGSCPGQKRRANAAFTRIPRSAERPAVSLYVDFDAEFGVRARYTRLEQVSIVANLRHAQYDVLNEAFEKG